jgi:hypothetical protein
MTGDPFDKIANGKRFNASSAEITSGNSGADR